MTTTLDPVDENEEELWRLRRLVASPPPPATTTATTTATIADLCPPSSSPTSRPRLKPPSLSSSTYRRDYKHSPMTLLEGSKAKSFGLGSERGRSEGEALAATAMTRSSSPPRGGGGEHCCHCCHCCSASSSAAAAETLSAHFPPPPRSLSPSKAKRIPTYYGSKENAPPSLQQGQKQKRNPPLQQPQRTSRVSGSALSDALASFREKEKQWLAEKAAFRREAETARRASLLSEALRAKEATARRHAEAELRAAKAAIRRRDDDDAEEKERNAATLAAAHAAAESRVRSAERAAALAASEAARAREKTASSERDLASERSRRCGAEREREGALRGPTPLSTLRGGRRGKLPPSSSGRPRVRAGPRGGCGSA